MARDGGAAASLDDSPEQDDPDTNDPETEMPQSKLDDAEWRNPANWHGGWLGIYYSRVDSRSFVPKRNPIMGFTINFARPGGIVFLIVILGFALGTIAMGVKVRR